MTSGWNGDGRKACEVQGPRKVVSRIEGTALASQPLRLHCCALGGMVANVGVISTSCWAKNPSARAIQACFARRVTRCIRRTTPPALRCARVRGSRCCQLKSLAGSPGPASQRARSAGTMFP